MLRMSPPLGDLLRLGDDGAEGRALLVKRAAVMDVDTVSVKAFPLWSDEETREAKGWLDDNGLRIGEVIPFYQGRHLGFHDPALHKVALASYSEQMHIAAMLGAQCVGFGWGKEFGWASPDIWSEETWKARVAAVAGRLAAPFRLGRSGRTLIHHHAATNQLGAISGKTIAHHLQRLFASVPDEPRSLAIAVLEKIVGDDAAPAGIFDAFLTD